MEIRSALHKKIIKNHQKGNDTLIINELGLAHGRNRIDVAVLDKHIHGYEIKSSKDTLARLSGQLNEYKKSLQKLTIVTAENHLAEILNNTPVWCGVTLAIKGPRGGITFKTIRRALLNPSADAFSIAHLLWRNETLQILKNNGINGHDLSGARKSLYLKLVDLLTINELVSNIKLYFRAREDWRVDLQPFENDD